MTGPRWERPDPPRLNDTSAWVRKGIHPYELKVAAYDGPPIETPWNPEHAFNGRGVSQIAVSGPYGCGPMVAVKAPAARRSGRTADGNGTVPRTGNLSAAVGECEKC